MTKAVLFFAATLVAAALGVVAQDSANSTGRSNEPVAQTSASDSHQSSPQQPATPAGANDSANKAATGAGDAGVQDTTAKQETPGTSTPELPQTSTVLPLLGLIGLGSLVAGFFARR